MPFRKSKKFGLFRLNVSGSGVSISGGVPGFRVSVNNKGDVRRTVSVPGSGWYDTQKIGSIVSQNESFDLKDQKVVVTESSVRVIEGEKEAEFPKNLIVGLRRSGSTVNVTLTGGSVTDTLPFECYSVEQATALRAAIAKGR